MSFVVKVLLVVYQSIRFVTLSMARSKESNEGDDDIDQLFLDQVLNQLYDFGELQ